MTNKKIMKGFRSLLKSLEWIDYVDEINEFLSTKPKLTKKDYQLLRTYNGIIFN